MSSSRNGGEPSTVGPWFAAYVLVPGLALVVWWLGLPGAIVLWIGVVAHGAAARPPALTGAKVNGRPTVGSDLEQKRLDNYFRASDLRDACLAPSTLLPGWPPYLSWLVAVIAGALVWGIPQAWDVTRWVDGFATVSLVAGFAAAGRIRNRAEPSPGTRLTTVPMLAGRPPGWKPATASGLSAVTGATIGVLAARTALAAARLTGPLRTLSAGENAGRRSSHGWGHAMPDLVRLRREWFDLTVPGLGRIPWPAAMRTIPGASDMIIIAAAGCLGLLIAVGPRWQKLALADWRALVQARGEWTERWAIVKADPAPRLVGHERIQLPATDSPGDWAGDCRSVIVDSFECSPAYPAGKALGLSAQLRPTLGDDRIRLALLPQPIRDRTTRKPTAGTQSTLAFRVVQWPDRLPDITAGDLPANLVELALESAMAWACESTGWSRMLLAGIASISKPDPAEAPASVSDMDVEVPVDEANANQPEPTDPGPGGRGAAAWAVEWVSPIGMEMVQVRLNLAGPMAESLGCDVLVDHRATGGRLRGRGVMYAGALTDGHANLDAELLPAPPGPEIEPADMMENLAIEDWWVGVWSAVLGSEANPPTPKHNVRKIHRLPAAPGQAPAEIISQPFVVRQGQDPSDFFGREAKLSSAMDSMGFIAITGFPDAQSRRPGDRHPMAFQVHYSRQPVPGITALPPCKPADALPLLAGRVNGAFRAAKLAQPEVYRVRPLTDPRSRGHIWEMTVRLHGGVTLADLRARHKQLRIAFGVGWLRLVDHGNDCRIIAGIDPSTALLGPDQRTELAGYDWEQVWRDAACTGIDGLLPTLTGTTVLPSNRAVTELIFQIPAGLDLPRLKAAKGRLAVASQNTFVDIGPGPEPSTVRLLVSRVDPMPTLAPYRFDLEPGYNMLGFADGIDGEPVIMNLAQTSHLLVTGTTGGGKSTAGQALMQGAFSAGADVVVIDVQKGCADFRFAEPWCLQMTGDLMDAAATMIALYEEVTRRKQVNSAHGTATIHELPEDVRPPDLVVFIDEFFGLITSPERPSTKPDPNPDLEQARLEQLAVYNAKAKIAYLTGRIGAEARAAGVHLVLMTQALSSKMKLPSSIADLKLNSNRILLGKATHGERTSALRQPETAPDPGEVVPPGRAVWEPVTSQARLVQFWYAPTHEYRAWLEANLDPVTDDQRLDIEPYRMDASTGAAFVITDETTANGRPSPDATTTGIDLGGACVPEDRTGRPPAPVGPDPEPSGPMIETFDDVELPELVDSDDIDWSVVVGATPPTEPPWASTPSETTAHQDARRGVGRGGTGAVEPETRDGRGHEEFGDFADQDRSPTAPTSEPATGEQQGATPPISRAAGQARIPPGHPGSDRQRFDVQQADDETFGDWDEHPKPLQPLNRGRMDGNGENADDPADDLDGRSDDDASDNSGVSRPRPLVTMSDPLSGFRRR